MIFQIKHCAAGADGTRAAQAKSGDDMKKLGNSNISTAFMGVGGIAMVIAGVVSFFHTGATLATISSVLGTIAIITGIVTLFMRLIEKSKGEALRLDFLIWFAIAFLLLNTSLLGTLGGIATFIIGIFLILQGANSIRLELTASSKDVFRIVIAVLFILAGLFAVLNSRRAFTELVGKVLGVYLVIHGVEMLKETWGQHKYNMNFKGVE
jgi:uncharacterized membrane protein HdeD (DUF308 family)